MSELYAKHEATLEAALTAIQSRGFWSAYPEIPSGRIYGETAAADGKAAFEARLNRPFQLDQPTRGGRIGAERSPYGFDLGVDSVHQPGQRFRIQTEQRPGTPVQGADKPLARGADCHGPHQMIGDMHGGSLDVGSLAAKGMVMV